MRVRTVALVLAALLPAIPAQAQLDPSPSDRDALLAQLFAAVKQAEAERLCAIRLNAMMRPDMSLQEYSTLHDRCIALLAKAPDPFAVPK